MAKDFGAVFEKLKTILQKYESGLYIDSDQADKYYLSSHQLKEELKAKHPTMFFGRVHSRKSYVSFYLMPVYTHPALLEDMSEGLKKRKQGNSCFNFKSVDEPLFEELAKLTERGYAAYQETGYIA